MSVTELFSDADDAFFELIEQPEKPDLSYNLRERILTIDHW